MNIKTPEGIAAREHIRRPDVINSNEYKRAYAIIKGPRAEDETRAFTTVGEAMQFIIDWERVTGVFKTYVK